MVLMLWLSMLKMHARLVAIKKCSVIYICVCPHCDVMYAYFPSCCRQSNLRLHEYLNFPSIITIITIIDTISYIISSQVFKNLSSRVQQIAHRSTQSLEINRFRHVVAETCLDAFIQDVSHYIC